MKISKIIKAAVIVSGLVLMTTTAYGQTVQATGTVLEPITFTTTTDLTFGTSIFPGVNKAVAPSDAGASQFDIDGETSATVTLNFSLPTELTHTDNTSTLAISFLTTDGVYNTSSDVGTGTSFDPSAEQTTTLGGTSGLLSVWLGGTVEPTSDQTQGVYAADITLDVAYTGQ